MARSSAKLWWLDQRQSSGPVPLPPEKFLRSAAPLHQSLAHGVECLYVSRSLNSLAGGADIDFDVCDSSAVQQEKLETRYSKPKNRNWKLEIRNWKLVIRNHSPNQLIAKWANVRDGRHQAALFAAFSSNW